MACKKIICSQTETTDTGVILIPNKAIGTLPNCSSYRLIIACNINTPTANQIVYVQTTDGNVPLLCKYGNNLLANQLNKRVSYCVNFGNENEDYAEGQFVMSSCNFLNNRALETTTQPISI